MHRAAVSKFFATVLTALALACALPAPGLAQDAPAASHIPKEIERLFQQHRQAVVRVRASDSLGIRLGSGFFVDPAGTVYTHAGVVLKADDVVVHYQGRSLPAKVVASDTRTGIALLKTDCLSPFIPVGDCGQMAVSVPVLAIGFPGEHDASPAIGLVAGRDFHQNGKQFSTSHLRMNMAVQPGFGGAPVLNFQGQVIGIVATRIHEGGSCLILPIRAAEKVRGDIARFGELRPGWVGMEVEDASSPVDGSIARIVSLQPDTPAARHGLLQGDVLLGINESEIRSIHDLVDAAFYLTAGEEAKFHISRDGEKMALGVEPVLHPNAAQTPLRAESTVLPVAQ
jgi:serine protease Do